jgi:hypothetical protein
MKLHQSISQKIYECGRVIRVEPASALASFCGASCAVAFGEGE